MNARSQKTVVLPDQFDSVKAADPAKSVIHSEYASALVGRGHDAQQVKRTQQCLIVTLR